MAGVDIGALAIRCVFQSLDRYEKGGNHEHLLATCRPSSTVLQFNFGSLLCVTCFSACDESERDHIGDQEMEVRGRLVVLIPS